MKKRFWVSGFTWLLVCFAVVGWGMLMLGMSGVPANAGAGQYVRLHILANSDSILDQQVKLKVRDAILHYITPYLIAARSKSEAQEIVDAHREAIITVADGVLKANGLHYASSLMVGRFSFPEKTYGSLTLPQGEYDAVRIILGAGEGHNWWCVLFPPLCLIDGAELQNAAVSQEQTHDSVGGDHAVILHWKLAEWLRSR